MPKPAKPPLDLEGQLLDNRLEVHDRKQFELKLEYQPEGLDPDAEYSVDAYLFLPSSLNIDSDTYPRAEFYANLHNYVRLKTPMLSFREISTGEHSPLVQIEQRLALGLLGTERELVYDAKMLTCVCRGALRRFSLGMKEQCAQLSPGAEGPSRGFQAIDALARSSVASVRDILERYRKATDALALKYPLEERTRISLRLVDEYLSLIVEQYFRKTVAQMEPMPRTAEWLELRKELMAEVVAAAQYRKEHRLRSVVSPQGDNEEYTHRIGFLKKFCMNILFLRVARGSGKQHWEEMLLALAAGLAMAFATAVAFLARDRFNQASFNFALVLIVGYMFKDRIKEFARRRVANYSMKHFFDRKTLITDPVTQERVGTCHEKVDYGKGVRVPPEIQALRTSDDFVAVSQGELAETVIRYQKKIVLEADMLPRMADGIATGVTDIVRFNVDRMLRDMDDPEYALEYIDLEDFTVDKVKASKSYQIDVALRFTVSDGEHHQASTRLVRFVLDKNGIKRMLEVGEAPRASAPSPLWSVA